MCTIAIEALTPLDRTSRIKLYKNIARSRLFCRIAKRSIETGNEAINKSAVHGTHLSFKPDPDSVLKDKSMVGMINARKQICQLLLPLILNFFDVRNSCK